MKIDGIFRGGWFTGCGFKASDRAKSWMLPLLPLPSRYRRPGPVESGPQGESDKHDVCSKFSSLAFVHLSIAWWRCSSSSLSSACEPKISQPLRVAIVGLEHGHVEGFLGQLAAAHRRAIRRHCRCRYRALAEVREEVLACPTPLFFKSEANMIERTRPTGRAGLYLDRRASPRHRDRRASTASQ